MDCLTSVIFVFVSIMAIIVLGADGFTGNNIDSEETLEKIISMMRMICTPAVVRDCAVHENGTLLAMRMFSVIGIIKTCTKNSKNTTQLRSDYAEARETTRAYRPLVRKYCDSLSTAKECVKGAIHRSRNCFCDAELEMMSLSPHAYDALYEFICVDYNDGERLVQFLDDGGVEFWTETHVNESKQCLELSTHALNFESVANFLSTRYANMKSIRDCLVRVGEGKTNTTNQLKEFFNVNLGLMRCVNGTMPDNLVSCKDLESNLISAIVTFY